MNRDSYKEFAKSVRELYLALYEAGFTPNQSMDLVKTVLMANTAGGSSNKKSSDYYIDLLKGAFAQ